MVTLKESQEEVTTTETSVRFDIKVVQNGNVVNTIPLIGENSIKETDTSVKKRVFSTVYYFYLYLVVINFTMLHNFSCLCI